MKGKDPHFGSEKSLYEQMLDVAGPLTCLWADLLNKEARTAAEDTLLLVQRALIGLARKCFPFYIIGEKENSMDEDQLEAEVACYRGL